MNNEILVKGLTASQWVELLASDEAKATCKALKYYDGEQEELMVQLLSDPSKGRRKWQERGIIPRFRNITQMIVQKSGLLFKDGTPKFEIYVGDSEQEDEVQSKKLSDELYKTEWTETFINLDAIVRLCKTGLVLVQYNAQDDQLVFDILTRANAQVMVNPATRAVEALIYRTSENGDTETFRIFTTEVIIDLMKVKEKLTVSSTEPNPYGMVPVTPFYDTNTPRSGFWNPVGYDLVAMNEAVNLHITDSEYAISWSKLPTLFTNMKFQNEEVETFSYEMIGNNPLPTGVASQEALLGGPSKAILMDSAGVDSPFIKYESPKVDIKPLDEVVEGWISAIAEDWSVKISGTDNARATSGFQVLVESMDNLDLRKSRQRMFEMGFKKFFVIVRQVLNAVKGQNYFSQDAELYVDFADPYIPIDQKAQEEVWSIRIAEGRASKIDYLMETLGITRPEAEEKLKQIQEDKKLDDAPDTPEPEEVMPVEQISEQPNPDAEAPAEEEIK